MTTLTRRHFLAAAAGLATAGALGSTAFFVRRATPRVLVIGGGPGGVAAARAVKAAMPDARVLVVERDPGRLVRRTAPDLVSGRREPADFDRLAGEGIDVALDDVRAIDWSAGRAEALSGRAFAFDRIVLAPGIAMRDEGIAGYDRETADLMPHGWTDRAGVETLAADIRAMADGGTVIIRIPPGRMRYPVGPYRRAGEIARYLEREKPQGRVVILDQSAPHPRKAPLLASLATTHGDRVRYVAGEAFGTMERIDVANRMLIGTRGHLAGDVINFIPAQQAGRIARVAGLAGSDGWCPLDAVTGRSPQQPAAYLVGEAGQAGEGADDTGRIARAAEAIAADIVVSIG